MIFSGCFHKLHFRIVTNAGDFGKCPGTWVNTAETWVDTDFNIEFSNEFPPVTC